MSEPVEVRGRRALTPAVAAASVFLALCALTSVSFVVARGGLELPTASGVGSPVAVASSPTAGAELQTARPSPDESTTPSAGSSVPASTALPATPAPSTSGPSPVPQATPSGPSDPLLALAACPGHPGCYLYVVRRGDSLSDVNDRFGLLLWITRALNPEIGSEGVIVVGQALYLGRDPEARLDPCPGGAACRLYVVRSGDTLSGIANRFGVTETGILVLNPGLAPNKIATGETIRLPLFH